MPSETLPVHSSPMTLPVHSSPMTLPVHSSPVTLPVHSSPMTLPVHSFLMTLPVHLRVIEWMVSLEVSNIRIAIIDAYDCLAQYWWVVALILFKRAHSSCDSDLLYIGYHLLWHFLDWNWCKDSLYNSCCLQSTFIESWNNRLMVYCWLGCCRNIKWHWSVQYAQSTEEYR